MLPGNIPGRTTKLRRVADDGTVKEFDILLRDRGLENGMTFRVDADVEDGDEITETLPNGKTRTVRLYDVEVRRSPMGSGKLDRTQAKYTVVTDKAALRRPNPVTLPGLHQLISAASGSQVATRHYDDAVFNALKAVEARVQALTGHVRHTPAVARKQAPTEYEQARSRVVRVLVRQPLHRLQKLTGKDKHGAFLYDDSWMHDRISKREIDKHGNKIQLYHGVATGLARLAGLLKPTIRIHWVEGVRTINPTINQKVPPIERYLFGADRIALARAGDALKDAFSQLCF